MRMTISRLPLAGALAFELDGVFVGATWTRDMRNAMVISLAVYLASFFSCGRLAMAGFGSP
jgi:multidrug resistance protein, MATE family